MADHDGVAHALPAQSVGIAALGSRPSSDGRVLQRVLGWLENIHGYLSAPAGGGVRHGATLDLDAMQIHEATLFANLIRSFVNYLLSEYERLQPTN